MIWPIADNRTEARIRKTWLFLVVVGLLLPRNLLGTFDVYHTTRHGTDWAGAPALVHATHAKVVV